DGEDYDDEDSRQARLTLNWMPGDSWNILAKAEYYKSDERPNTADAISVDPAAPFVTLANLAAMIGGYGMTASDWVDGKPREGTYNFGRPAVPGDINVSAYQPTTSIAPDEAINEIGGLSLIVEVDLT